MTSLIPITLMGNNLGERHHHLNSLVSDAHKRNVPFESILQLPDNSPVDKLFKIELASKYRNVDYILKILTNEDMLYVTKALKSLWLLEPQYIGIINPTYLEVVLYPSMVTTAVNKMRHWLKLHLRGEERCKIFYEYYNKTDFNLAIHFLARCSSEFLLLEVNNILDKLTPHYMKLLGEKYPSVAKIYFNSLESRPSYINYYISNENEFYNSLKCLLKADADMVLDIVEKYFHLYYFRPFSAEATKYIIRNCKSRFNNKIELYTAFFLDIKTLAKYLSSEEIKKVILRLACAEYLNSWFTYKNVEPLIKRLNNGERKVFKKQVFIDKSIGTKAEELPYELPSPPDREETYDTNVFKDKEHYHHENELTAWKRKITKRKKRKIGIAECFMFEECDKILECRSLKCESRSLLETLFDMYRFVSFERTLYKLRKQITAESSSQNRQYILLVLVSKTGGRSEFLLQLLQLLVEKCINEPSTVRAAVVRSLVKRAGVWRLPDESWNMFLKFSHGLGLDGTEPEVACKEGIHAVVLRDIIQNKDPSVVVFKSFLESFSSFSEYSLDITERSHVRESLPRLLIPSTEENCEQAVKKLEILLDFSKSYNLAFETYSNVVKVVKFFAHQNPKATQTLLQNLFNSRITRKHFFRENFEFIQTDDSYVNALRHDITLLATCEKFEKIIENDVLRHDKFLQKLALYFNENDGLAARYLAVLENRVLVKSNIQLARSIAILAGNSVWERITALKSIKTRETKVFATALLDNVHLSKPLWDLHVVQWRLAGVKAIANRVSVCSAINAEENLRRLLEWNRTARVALMLSQRVGKEALVFQTVATVRPTVALKAAIKYFTKRQETIDQRVWLAVKPIIPIYIDRKSRCKMFSDTDKIPSVMKADYCTVVYKAFDKIHEGEAIKILCVLESSLPELEETFISGVIENFIHENFTAEKIFKLDCYFDNYVNLCLRIMAKFLLYSETEDEQLRKMAIIAEPFFERIENLYGNNGHVADLIYCFISALTYNTMFFDKKCVSALPIFEIIIQRVQKFLPIYKYFDMYVQIHLTMLYYKSVRQSIKNYPEVFGEEKRKVREGVNIVGNIFGKYIAHELDVLIQRYFISMKHIYKEELVNYLSEFGCHGKKQFCMSVVTGIAESEKPEALSVAEYIFERERSMHNETDKEKCTKILEESDDLETKFLLYAEAF